MLAKYHSTHEALCGEEKQKTKSCDTANKAEARGGGIHKK